MFSSSLKHGTTTDSSFIPISFCMVTTILHHNIGCQRCHESIRSVQKSSTSISRDMPCFCLPMKDAIDRSICCDPDQNISIIILFYRSETQSHHTSARFQVHRYICHCRHAEQDSEHGQGTDVHSRFPCGPACRI